MKQGAIIVAIAVFAASCKSAVAAGEACATGIITLSDWEAGRVIMRTEDARNIWVVYGGKRRSVGDILTAKGQWRDGSEIPILENSDFVKNHGRDPDKVPRPVAASLEELQVGPLVEGGVEEWFGRIVEISGTVELVKGRRSELFMLRDGERSIPIHYSLRPSDRPLDKDLKDGARVVVKGSYLFDIDTTRFPGTREITDARLWVNYAEDIKVLAPPPWWTVERVTVAGAIATGLVAAFALLWFALARARREAHLRRRVLRDRQQVADRLHDTIDQHLAGANFLLTAALASKSLAGVERDNVEKASQVLADAKTATRDMIMSLRTEAIGDAS